MAPETNVNPIHRSVLTSWSAAELGARLTCLMLLFSPVGDWYIRPFVMCLSAGGLIFAHWWRSRWLWSALALLTIGRALIGNPKVLLLDEPLASLDQARRLEILPYLERLRGFPAAESTTEEIARYVREEPDRALLPLLRAADLVKFADTRPSPARKEEDVRAVRDYIRVTGELAEAAQEPGAGP